MKILFLAVAAMLCAAAAFSQQSPRGLRKSDDAETIPIGTTSSKSLVQEAVLQAGGLTVGQTTMSATSGNGFNGTLSVSWKTEIGGEEVEITVEYEPPPNMARQTALRLFRIDVEAAMREFPPIKTQA